MEKSLVLPFSLGMRTIAYQVVRAYAGPKYGPPTTKDFKPDAGAYNTTCDGEPWRAGVSETWYQIRTRTGLAASTTATTLHCSGSTSGTSGRWYSLARSIATFDLSIIPVGSIINWANVYIWGDWKGKYSSWNPSIAVFQSYPNADNVIVTGDYLRLYATALSNVIWYASYNTAGWNTFNLNAAGLALIVPGQIVRLGWREATYDATGVAPTPWSSWKAMGFRFKSRDYSASYSPILRVNYSPLL